MNKLFLKIRELITKPYFKYVIITVAFIIWMTFLDTNSFQIHNELNDEINILEKRYNVWKNIYSSNEKISSKFGSI